MIRCEVYKSGIALQKDITFAITCAEHTLLMFLLKDRGINVTYTEDKHYNVMLFEPYLFYNNKTILLFSPLTLLHISSNYLEHIKELFNKFNFISLFRKKQHPYNIFLFKDNLLVNALRKPGYKQIFQFLEVNDSVPLDVVEKINSNGSVYLKDKCYVITQSTYKLRSLELPKHSSYVRWCNWYCLLHLFCFSLQDIPLYLTLNEYHYMNKRITIKHNIGNKTVYEVLLLCKDDHFHSNFTQINLGEISNYFYSKPCTLKELYLPSSVLVRGNYVLLVRNFPTYEVLCKYNIVDAEQLHGKVRHLTDKKYMSHLLFKYENNNWKYINTPLSHIPNIVLGIL